MTIAEQLRREGIQQGMQHEREQIAIKLLMLGMPIEKIAQLTNLSAEEIRKLELQKH